MIHPKARIIAEAGPIVIGEGNLIEEQALIINAWVRLLQILWTKGHRFTADIWKAAILELEKH